MYCGKCGNKINDTASFCPYCGGAVAGGNPKAQAEAPRQSVNNVSDTNIEEDLPVFKRQNKAAFLVAFIPLICIIFRTMIVVFGIVGVVTTRSYNAYPAVEYAVPDAAVEQSEGGAM